MLDLDPPTVPIRAYAPPARVRPYVRPACPHCYGRGGLHTRPADTGRHGRCPAARPFRPGVS